MENAITHNKINSLIMTVITHHCICHLLPPHYQQSESFRPRDTLCPAVFQKSTEHARQYQIAKTTWRGQWRDASGQIMLLEIIFRPRIWNLFFQAKRKYKPGAKLYQVERLISKRKSTTEVSRNPYKAVFTLCNCEHLPSIYIIVKRSTKLRRIQE